MSIQRTPPSTKLLLRQGQSVSESDLSTTIETGKKQDGNITVRNKRQRVDDSPECGKNQFARTFNEFKNEIMQMLTSWKAENDDRLSIWKSEHDAVLSGLVKDLSDLKNQCTQIRKSHSEMDQSLKFTNACYEDIKNKLFELENQKRENVDRINQLDQHIQDLQLQSRPATLELRNFLHNPKESSEDLLAMVTAVGKVIDIDLQASNLRDLYRLPGTSATPRPIVAEFVSVSKRNEFLTAVRRYNKGRPVANKLNSHTIGLSGENKPIYVDEHLTPSKKKLFYDARVFAKENNFSCWNSYGRIFIRKDAKDTNEKPTQIKTVKCLLTLVKKQ